MTKLALDLAKNIDENASAYFEKAKKIKKKTEGAEAALNDSIKKLQELELKKEKITRKESKEREFRSRKKEWYEKFRGFFSSEGFLVVGGRDATSNEIIIKKHTDKDDIVFHTDMAGSPFFVVKAEGKKVGESTLQECADATACYSRAWKLGLATLDVFYVKPEQVSKEPNPGEYVAKGAFIIRGKTNYLQP